MSANTSCFFSRVFNRDPLSECNILSTYFDGNKQEYDDAIKLYNEFIKKYGNELLKYNIDLRDPGQRSQRFITFIRIVKQINEHNNDPYQTWSKEINLFTVFEDFEVPKGLKPNPAPGPAPAPAPAPGPAPGPDQVPFNNFSWSNYNGSGINYVSEPKYQINLECCWAFGGIEAIETVNAINTDSLVKGSVQHLLRVYSNNDTIPTTKNCDTTCGINYLQSGLYICGDKDTIAREFDTNGNVTTIKYNHDDLKQSLSGGIAKLNDNNKYTGICPGCDTEYSQAVLPNTCVESFDIYNNISIAALKSLLDNGPVLAEIDSSSKLFHHYSSGVISGKKLKCGGTVSPDHVILIIGYGYDETSKLNYWLCKNSWGTNWGEELPAWAVAPDQKSKPGNVNAGYFKVEANADNIICIQKQVIGNIKLK